jgi:hypothetical protein
MDTSFISAISGLTGAAIGGLTSFAGTWYTQQSQLVDKNRQAHWSKREQLFSAFIVEASRLYGDALTHQNDNVSILVRLYALVGRMRLVASRDVVVRAEKIMDTITQTYLEPNRTLLELREYARQGGVNLLQEFGEACRKELDELSHECAHRYR